MKSKKLTNENLFSAAEAGRSQEGDHFHLQVQKQTKPVATGGKHLAWHSKASATPLRELCPFPKQVYNMETNNLISKVWKGKILYNKRLHKSS